MQGTGGYNLGLGIVATAQGIGASLSSLVAGVIADHFGYGMESLAAGTIAAVASAVVLPVMPETAFGSGPRTWSGWSLSTGREDCPDVKTRLLLR
jgi:hypothetical protein